MMDEMADTSNLYCLTYVSRIANSERDRLRQTVTEILSQSQHLNGRDGITGVLVFDNTYFAQALEGDRSAVEAKFGAISRDKRHMFPTVLSQGPIAERSFAAWSMCARPLSKLDNDILDRLANRGAFPPGPDGGALIEQLRAIARIHQEYFDRQSRDVAYL